MKMPFIQFSDQKATTGFLPLLLFTSLIHFRRNQIPSPANFKSANDLSARHEEKYRALVEEASDAILICDIDGNILETNGSARKLFGYSKEEMDAMKIWQLYLEAELKELPFGYGDLLEKKVVRTERTIVCMNRSQLPVEVTVKLLSEGRFMVIMRDNNERRRTENDLKAAIEKYDILAIATSDTQSGEDEKRVATAIIDAQEKERLHLGRELHDNVNQILACAHLTLEATCDYHSDVNKIVELIETAKGTIELAISEIRKLSHHLAPADIEEACLKNIIEHLIERINVQRRYSVECEIDEAVRGLTDDRLIVNLYRIIQEQLKNILKHADARRITVVLSIRDEIIHLKIDDDGRGFDPRTAYKGIGLNNIKKRVESLYGKFVLRSAPGKGCTIIAELPMSNHSPQ